MRTYPSFKLYPDDYCLAHQKSTLRHELVHAFLYESGLDSCSHVDNGPWALNEELIDYLSI